MIRSIFIIFILLANPLFGSTWSPPHQFGSVESRNPTVSINSDNQAVVVWKDYEKVHEGWEIETINAAYYDGESWSDPTLISSDLGLSISIQVQIDASGRAIAVWHNYDREQIQASVFNGKSWSSPKNLSGDEEEPYFPQMSMNENGEAIVVWEGGDEEEGISGVFFNGSYWSRPSKISPQDHYVWDAQVGIDANGHAIVIWASANGSVEATHFDGSNWSEPVEISSFDTENPETLELAVNSLGQAAAVWNSEEYEIQAAYFDGEAWLSTASLTRYGYDVSDPHVGIDDQGNAIAIWTYSDRPGYYARVRSSYFDGKKWNSMEEISPSGDDCLEPQISVNGDGKAFAIWSNDTKYTVQVRCFDENWLSVTDLNSNENALSLQIDFSDSGAGIATWMDYNYRDYVYVSIREGIVERVLPPVNLTAVQKKNRFATQTDTYNVISWDPSPSDNVAFYRVLCDGFYLGEVPCTGPLQIEDHRRKQGASYSYSVFSVDQKGEESEPARITIS